MRTCHLVVLLRSVLLGALSASCGSAPLTPSAPQLPVPESSIAAVVNNFAKGATSAANTTSAFSAPGLRSFSLSSIMPRALTTVLVNESFTQRTNCTSGGYHVTNGRISGTIDLNASFSRLTMSSTTSIVDYACLGPGWLVNGDPYISNSGELRVTGSHASFDFSQSLGWRANNMNSGGSFSCQHNVKVTWDDLTNGRVQGYVRCQPPVTSVTLNETF